MSPLYLVKLKIAQKHPTTDYSASKLNSTQQDITDVVGADTSYVRIYMSNLIKTL